MWQSRTNVEKHALLIKFLPEPAQSVLMTTVTLLLLVKTSSVTLMSSKIKLSSRAKHKKPARDSKQLTPSVKCKLLIGMSILCFEVTKLIHRSSNLSQI